MNLLGTFAELALAAQLIGDGDVDWTADWDQQRLIDSSGMDDPFDERVNQRGTGSIQFGSGTAIMKGPSPRIYVHAKEGLGWENVEVSAYGKFVEDGDLRPWSGLTIVARSSHDLFGEEPCQAFGYYARIYRETGECAFQKEYFHENGESAIYTRTNRVDCFPDLGFAPMDTWIGMKFIVRTNPFDEVELELYLDFDESGDWTLVHSFVDSEGAWMSDQFEVPSECPQGDGDPVLGPRNVCFFRADGSDVTEVHWKDAKIRNLGPSLYFRGDGTTETMTQL